MTAIRVLLADDQTVVRRGLRTILETEPDIGAELDAREPGAAALGVVLVGSGADHVGGRDQRGVALHAFAVVRGAVVVGLPPSGRPLQTLI